MRLFRRAVPRKITPGRADRRGLRFETLEPRRVLAPLLLEAPDLEGVQNVILMIGDGMGPEHVNAARMFLGGEIVFDQFPHQAEMTTAAADTPITDSAASASAMATGRKVNYEVVSVALPGDGSDLTTSLELDQAAGKATGLVTTTQITHATPAGFAAHAANRYSTDEIAADLLQTKPNVMFGGGGAGMTVQDAVGAGYTVVGDRSELLALDTDTEDYVSGQFGTYHLPYEYDGLGTLPHLSEMTTVALDLLDNDPDGFFLMVEGGRIDHAAHVNDIQRNVRETVEFANTVELVLDWAAGRTDTLVIVTADHETGGLTVVNDNGPGQAPDVTWTTSGHTATNVPVYAWGPGANLVTGVLDNTDIYSLTVNDVRDLHEIEFAQLEGLDPAAGELWFRGETTRQGVLTLEATVPGGGEPVTLSLLDAELNELETATGDGQVRIDWTSDAAQTYYIGLGGNVSDVDLRLANLVQFNAGGAEMNVFGTPRDDSFAVEAGPTMVVSIGGLRYEAASVGSLHLAGGGGSDDAVVTGTAADEAATMRPGYTTLAGVDYDIELVDVATVTVVGGGGNDVVDLFDTAGRDEFLGAPNYGRIEGDGFYSQAVSFPTVYGHGTAGSRDVAKLFDSPGKDLYVAGNRYGRIEGDGFQVVTVGFDHLHAYATAGGYDVAKLFDSPADDVLYATPMEAVLYGPGFLSRAKHFEGVHTYAVTGGNDLAQFYGSPGDDVFFGNATEASCYGDGFLNRAKHFEDVVAYGADGGADSVYLVDSPGNDQLIATPSYVELVGEGFRRRAMDFGFVQASATNGGYDTAKLFDSPGNDQFVATPTSAELSGDGFLCRMLSFEGVHAYATAGGVDTAELSGWSGDDNYYGDPVQGVFYGDGFLNRAKYFEQVFAEAGAGGEDNAYLVDSSQVDLLEAEADWARLSNAVMDFLHEVSQFGYVRATATTAGDTLDRHEPPPLEFTLDPVGPWEE